jgi:hypothetical protein
VAQDSIPAIRGLFDASSEVIARQRRGQPLQRGSGEYGWYHFDFTSIFGEDDSRPGHHLLYDVTHQHQKELAFQRWQQSYNAIRKCDELLRIQPHR